MKTIPTTKTIGLITSKRPTGSLTIAALSTIAMLATSGCATRELLDSRTNYKTNTTVTKQNLVEDRLVAFGRPAQPLPKMPVNSVVIVGEKNSYVLSQGGAEMVKLLTTLSPQYIKVESDMSFYSPNNDGYFEGNMKMSYARLKDEFQRSDYQFFLQNGGTECSRQADTRINAQRFCFSIPIRGGVYPQVSNLNMIQSKYKTLTKPYPVTIYTKTTSQSTSVRRSGPNAAQKLVLLPFALAFDVVTLPLQIFDEL